MKRSVRVLVAAVLLVTGLLALPGNANAAFPGQNGKIAFTRGGDIWTMNPDGTNQTNLTNSAANEYTPAWSADGNRIGFIRNCCEIWTMLADGTGQTQTSGLGNYGPTWSPDGQKVAFTIDGRCEPFPGGEMGGVWTVPPDGSGSMTLVGCGSGDRGQADPSWSPDGQTIALREDLGAFDIYTMPANGSGPGTPDTNLTNDGYFDLHPDWSPDNQKIAWDSDRITNVQHIWTMNPDGSGKVRLTSATAVEEDPAWSPDGSKVAYFQSTSGIRVVNASGTGDTFLANGTAPSWQPLPTAGPESDLIAAISDSPDPIPTGGELHYTAQAKNLVGPDDATGVVLTVSLDPSVFFVSATPTQGSCTQASNVVTCQFGNVPKGTSATVDIKVEPRGPATITASASATGNESDPVPGNNSASTTTTVTAGGQPRPKGATPLNASLVIAFKACTPEEQNEQHGGPLNVFSCDPPVQTSSYLTVGTLDSNGQPAQFMGSVRFDVIPGDTNPSNGDQADVGLKASLVDVRNKPSLSDYTGELQGISTLRITDHDNGAGGFTAATVIDLPLDFTIPCSATTGSIGGSCLLDTTLDAVTGGAVKEQKRAIWQLERLRVFDGGADGNVDTAPNTLFATEGVFVP